jgi:hypothetical protein
MNPYKIDFTTKTLTITKAFSDASADPNSEEYAILTQFQKDIRGLKIVRKTHKTPTKYHNASGETTSRNQFKNLTYENMERFMNALPQREELMEVYTFLRYDAGFIQTNAYKTVRDWFMAQFPKFRSNPLFYINNEVKVIKPSFEEGRQDTAA